jgi:hypothetical protein
MSNDVYFNFEDIYNPLNRFLNPFQPYINENLIENNQKQNEKTEENSFCDWLFDCCCCCFIYD